MFMQTRIIIKSAGQLTENERRLCLKHNLGQEGTMANKAEGVLFEGYPGEIGILWGKQKKQLLFLGWFLISDDDGQPQLDTYVCPQYRYRGYGRQLVVAAQRSQQGQRLEVEPWNPQSRAFYARCQADCLPFLVPWHTDNDEWQAALEDRAVVA